MTANKRRVGRPRGTGSRRVYTEVRNMILTLRLPPGSDLDETRLEEEFGVSRTPVREALIRLASEGLVTLLPNRGARVTPLDVSDVPQLFEALELVQRAVTRFGAVRRRPGDLEELNRLSALFEAAAAAGEFERMGDVNKEFHLAVSASCGNKYLASQYESLLSSSLRLARMVFAKAMNSSGSHQGYYDEVIRHHREMIEAIERQDAPAADALAREHAQLFRNRVVQYVQSSLADQVVLED